RPVAEGIQFNVPPGTRPITLHRLGDGGPHADRLFWGYKPPWYERSPAANARLDTILKRSPFWRPLLSRRIIVPADGWYEWTGKKGNKQPWFISARDERPVLMAGITAWVPGKQVLAETGFAIITDDAAGGMVDIHDRRPICLTPEDAQAWIRPDLAVDEALELLSKIGNKQPWSSSARDERPVLMAGITAWVPGKQVLAETGFAIITDDAAGGMVDIHDRRPICLTPEDAQAWIRPDLAVDEALELLS